MSEQEKVLSELGDKIDAANRQRRGLIAACKATLLLHSGSPWSPAMAEEWSALTGRREVTTRALCDFVREKLSGAE